MDRHAASPTNPTLDLTGLPEQTVQEVLRIVREAREKQAGQPGEAANGFNSAPPARDAGGPLGEVEAFPMFLFRPRPSPEESRRLLNKMASRSSGQALPPDFSRTDIYDDHD